MTTRRWVRVPAPQINPLQKTSDVTLRVAPLSVHRRNAAENTTSVASNSTTNSGSTTYSAGELVPSEPERDSALIEYHTDDEKEDKRLRELHELMREFWQLQRNYVELLQHIGEVGGLVVNC